VGWDGLVAGWGVVGGAGWGWVRVGEGPVGWWGGVGGWKVWTGR
jgi:hypothetical protein